MNLTNLTNLTNDTNLTMNPTNLTLKSIVSIIRHFKLPVLHFSRSGWLALVSTNHRTLITKTVMRPLSSFLMPNYLLSENNYKYQNDMTNINPSVFRNSRHKKTTHITHLLTSNDVEENPGPALDRPPDNQAAQHAPIQAITYNVRGLGDERKMRHLLSYLQQRKSGKNRDFIACLQESYVDKAGKIPYIW